MEAAQGGLAMDSHPLHLAAQEAMGRQLLLWVRTVWPRRQLEGGATVTRRRILVEVALVTGRT